MPAPNVLDAHLRAPVIPALAAWDGTVSALRTYAPGELLDLARDVLGAEVCAFAAERVGLALSFTDVLR